MTIWPQQVCCTPRKFEEDSVHTARSSIERVTRQPAASWRCDVRDEPDRLIAQGIDRVPLDRLTWQADRQFARRSLSLDDGAAGGCFLEERPVGELTVSGGQNRSIIEGCEVEPRLVLGHDHAWSTLAWVPLRCFAFRVKR